MGEKVKAKLFRNGGSQAVRLPAEYRFDGEEVYISRDESTGDVILSSRPERDAWKAFIAFRNSLGIRQEGADEYMAERPMNQPVNRRSVFEDEE